MRQKSATPNSRSERLVESIRRATRKQYSAEEWKWASDRMQLH